MHELGKLVRKLIDALTLKNLAIGAAIFFISALVWIGTSHDSKRLATQSNTGATAQKKDDENWKAKLDAAEDSANWKAELDATVAAKKEKEAESNRNTASMGAALQLWGSMRNPDSFILEKARANDDGSVVCLWYRSQNGFGGMNRTGAYMRGAVLHPDADATSFHKFCVADPSVSHDVLQAANVAVKHFNQ
jgi:hypothetical protein